MVPSVAMQHLFVAKLSWRRIKYVPDYANSVPSGLCHLSLEYDRDMRRKFSSNKLSIWANTQARYATKRHTTHKRYCYLHFRFNLYSSYFIKCLFLIHLWCKRALFFHYLEPILEKRWKVNIFKTILSNFEGVQNDRYQSYPSTTIQHCFPMKFQIVILLINQWSSYVATGQTYRLPFINHWKLVGNYPSIPVQS